MNLVFKIIILANISCYSVLAFSFQSSLPNSFFYNLYNSHLKAYTDKNRKYSRYDGAVFTVLKLSKSLLTQNAYYSNINYDDNTRVLEIIISVNNNQNETGYAKLVFNDVSTDFWHKLQLAIKVNDVKKLNNYYNEILTKYNMEFFDLEIDVNNSIATKDLALILPVLQNAPESLALSSYPANLYLRMTYDKQDNIFILDGFVDYKDRARINMNYEAIYKGGFYLNDLVHVDESSNRHEHVPMFMVIELINDTLIQDMIKLESGTNNEFISTVIRQKVALDIESKAQKTDSEIAKNYYTSLASFVANPISLKLVVKNNGKNSEAINDFWYNLSQVAKTQSVLQLTEFPDNETEDPGSVVRYKLRAADLAYRVNRLFYVINESLSLTYYVNGHKLNLTD
ncbi:hypothetical protein OAO18_01315 [Francisellaceae bacterium]|nr:hypothetical protein [Francisellaceae bacterium]